MIEKTTIGRFRARLRLKGHPEVSQTFATRAAAQRWHQQIEDAAKLGLLTSVLAAEQTFAQALRLYADKTTPGKRGAAQELQRIGQLEGSPLADLKLASVDRRVLREYRDRRLRTIAESTWNRELSLITQVLKHAVAEHDAKLDVRDLVVGLRGKESPGRTGRISPAAESKLLAAADKVSPWAAALVRLSLALGTRRGELHGLRHADIDRQAMTVHIRGTKTEASDRLLPISSGTLAIIDSLPRSLADDRLFWQADKPEDLTYAWRRCCYHAGLDLCLHLCRHECLSRLAEGGASIPLLKGFSGHTTLAMLGRYARPAAEGLRALIAA